MNQASTFTREHSPLTRCTRRKRCPVCNRDHFCSVSADGALAICTKKPSERQTRDGQAWIHILRYDDLPAPQRLKPLALKPTPATERADNERIVAVYADLLRLHLVLSEQHRKPLLARGLDDLSIGINGYASVPTQLFATNVARALAREHDLRGVPGFYRVKDSWRMVSTGNGFFVPVRGWDGRLRGMQVRRDDGEPRYIWFSSAGREGGASSRSPVHYANAHLLKSTAEVTLTEGALKADVIAHLTGAPVIAAAGVTNFGADFATNLKQRFPNIKTCNIAFDMDVWQSLSVFAALERLAAQLEGAGFGVRVLEWSKEFKGFDDYLIAQLRRKEVA
jgi:hypothetical protein